jgi:hypothetical protein
MGSDTGFSTAPVVRVFPAGTLLFSVTGFRYRFGMSCPYRFFVFAVVFSTFVFHVRLPADLWLSGQRVRSVSASPMVLILRQSSVGGWQPLFRCCLQRKATSVTLFENRYLLFRLCFQNGGGGRTRTYEGVSQRIYSPPPLPLGTLPRKRAYGNDRRRRYMV